MAEGAEPVADIADDQQLDDVPGRYRLAPQAVVEDEGVTGEHFRAGHDDQAQGDAKGDAHDDMGRWLWPEITFDGIGQQDAESQISPAQEGHHDVAQGIFLEEMDLGRRAFG